VWRKGCSRPATSASWSSGAEHLSRWVDWTDRNMAVLIADGAGATVLEYDPVINDVLSFVPRAPTGRPRTC
jgi:hypothetical protein